MRVLYVFPHLYEKQNGGSMGYKRSYDCLCNYYGKDSVISFPIERKENRNKLKMLFNDLIALGWGITVDDKKEIVRIVRENQIDVVYIDSALLGGVSYYLKRRLNVKTIVFFHNVEFDFVRELVLSKRNYLCLYRVWLAYYNEKKASKYSDVIIALNSKDSQRLNNLYGRYADYTIPVALKVEKTIGTEGCYSNPLKLLFFGSNFPPNIEAAEIFINKILPHIDARLVIAGNGMESLLLKHSNSEKLEIRGFVDDVRALYKSADIVVMPIFSGAGMKVKTAEALMYGKNIIASSNALEGYDIDAIPGIIRCDTIKEFIEAINCFDKNNPRYNIEARKVFINKYSYDASYEAFNRVFEALK